MRIIRQWLQTLWQPQDREFLLKSYAATFNSADGQRVLHDLVDNVYATVYEGSDPVMLAVHNGRRSLLHEILENIDHGVNPQKYETGAES